MSWAAYAPGAVIRAAASTVHPIHIRRLRISPPRSSRPRARARARRSRMMRHYIPAGRPSVYGASVTRTLQRDEVPPSCGISAPCGSTSHPESVRGAADQGGLMDCGACGVAGHGAIIGFADPGHARLVMSARQVTPVVDTFAPVRPRGGDRRLAISRASPDLTRSGHFGQEPRRDEFHRTTVSLLYVGPGRLSPLPSR